MILPYGGQLINRLGTDEMWPSQKAYKATTTLSFHDFLFAVNIGIGAFSPLEGFMNETEYHSVITDGKLSTGLEWPLPILLRVSEQLAEKLRKGDLVRLVLNDGQFAGVLLFEDAFEINQNDYCQRVYGTTSRDHVGVFLSKRHPKMAISGKLRVNAIQLPTRKYFFQPAAVREEIDFNNWKAPVAFSTRNIQHLGHKYQQDRAISEGDGLGIFVISGAEKPGSLKTEVVLNSYQTLCEKRKFGSGAIISELLLPPLYAGPREAALQAIMLQNYGFRKFIVGRDHAGVGSFYPKYASQGVFKNFPSLEIEILKYPDPLQCLDCKNFSFDPQCSHCGLATRKLTGSEIRELLLKNDRRKLKNLLAPEVLQYLVSLSGKRGAASDNFAHLFVEDS